MMIQYTAHRVRTLEDARVNVLEIETDFLADLEAASGSSGSF